MRINALVTLTLRLVGLYALALITAFGLMHGANAAATNALSLQDQRYTYELAKSQLQKNKISAFKASRAKLGDYALAPYLDYQFLMRSFNSSNKTNIEAFIRTHRGSYLGERMLRRYLRQLAQNQDWAGLVYWYKPEVASETMTCKWLEARHAVGDNTALASLNELWVVAKSLPKACDSLFKTWFKSEFYSHDYAWQRFLKAMAKSKQSLARYASSKLPSDQYDTLVQHVRELDRRPYKIRKLATFKPTSYEMQEVVAFGIKKYARNHPVEALSTWEQYEASSMFDETLTRDVKVALVNNLLRKKKNAHVQSMLRSSPSIRSADAIERLLRVQLKEKNWNSVKSTIALLPVESRNSDRWTYWHTRAALELGTIAESQATVAFKSLAQKRSFYGFLSADRIQTNYALENQSSAFPESTIEQVANKPAIRRAKELWLTNYQSEARAEWYYGLDQLSVEELAAAGVLANQWGWYDRGIQAMIAGKHWDHLDVRFPLAFKDHILEAADETALSPSFIFAVARQESAMSEQAKSSAGARGLMQLMPATAKQTARKRGIQHRTDDLYRAEHNIQLGSQYLDELLSQFNGNRILAAAAYNAGPHRVSTWRANQDLVDYDIWIETIPFKETRGYVQNVLTYAVIYSLRMGKPANLITKVEANQKL